MRKVIYVSLLELILLFVGAVLLLADNPLGLIAGVIIFRWMNRTEHTIED